MALIPRYQQNTSTPVGGAPSNGIEPPIDYRGVASAVIQALPYVVEGVGKVAGGLRGKPSAPGLGGRATGAPEGDAMNSQAEHYAHETIGLLGKRPIGDDGRPAEAAETVVAEIGSRMGGGLAQAYSERMQPTILASAGKDRTFADFAAEAGLSALATGQFQALEQARAQEAGDPTGFAHRQAQTARESIDGFLESLPAESRPRWTGPARALQGQISDQSFRAEAALREAFQVRAIDQVTGQLQAEVARDPALFEDRRARGLGLIDAATLSPSDRAARADAWGRQVTRAYGAGLARAQPDALLGLLEGPPDKDAPAVFSDLSEDDRAGLAEMARRSQQARAADEARQGLQARAAWRQAFETGLKAGVLGHADIAAAVSAGQLSGPAEVRAATALAQDHTRRQASLVSFAKAAADPKHGWNPADADQRQTIDDVFEAGERTPADVEDLWRLTGVLPTRAAARLRGDLDSADPARVAVAAGLLTAMRQARPEDYASHDDAQSFTPAEAMFNHRIEQYGDTPEAAAQAVIALRDPIAGIVDNAAAAVRGMNGPAASILSASERLMAATIRSIRLTAPPAEQDSLIHDAGARLGQVVLARYDTASGKDFLADLPDVKPWVADWNAAPSVPDWAMPLSELSVFDKPTVKPTIDKIIKGAGARGLDVSTVLTLLWVENAKADPMAENGSYAGLFQLGPVEWKEYGGAKENRFDVDAQIRVGLAAIADRQAYLNGVDNTGRPRLDHRPEPWELYLAHQQGGWGAVSLIRADPDALAAEVLAKASNSSLKRAGDKVRNNLGAIYMKGVPGTEITVAQYRNYWIQSFAEKQRQVRERYQPRVSRAPAPRLELPPRSLPEDSLAPRLWPHLFPPLFNPST